MRSTPAPDSAARSPLADLVTGTVALWLVIGIVAGVLAAADVPMVVIPRGYAGGVTVAVCVFMGSVVGVVNAALGAIALWIGGRIRRRRLRFEIRPPAA